MNFEHQKKLLPFYFGSLDEEERLLMERELLTDSEVLVHYLDLKRELEAARPVPSAPSCFLWHRLRAQMTPRQKFIFSMSLGAAVAACLIVFSIFWLKPHVTEHHEASPTEMYFDSNHELSTGSNVL